MKVYDDKGVEYDVPHLVDVAEWIGAGYSKDKPVPKKKAPQKKRASQDKE